MSVQRSRFSLADPRVVTVVAVASIYFYFLIFAEFALLDLVRAEAARVRTLMSGLGLGGILGSLLAARFRCETAALLERLAFTLGFAGLLAGGAPLWAEFPLAPLFAGGVGLSLGLATVWLCLALPVLCPPRQLGFCIGLGTGIAYGAANIPSLFTAGAQLQCAFASAVALLGAVPLFLASRTPAYQGGSPAVPRGVELRPDAVILLFLALVWLDSAAFYVIQHNAALKQVSWAENPRLWSNALLHFGAAVFAGFLLDKTCFRRVVFLAWCLLCAGSLLVQHRLTLSFLGGSFYAIGVSLYSTTLVWEASRRRKPWYAALLFAIAGWFGSGMGIGMVQHLSEVPLVFLVVSGLVVFFSLGSSSFAARSGALVLFLFFAFGLPHSWAAKEDSLLRGRAVYVAEGCVNCHSQYIRPGNLKDLVAWGPARPQPTVPPGEAPLIGNRRLGPDLSMVGNRRNREWNRLHLINPRALIPGSAMPSYARLFERENTAGDDLLDYLSSLGVDTVEARKQSVEQWRPLSLVPAAKPEKSAWLWAALCASCHGKDADGKGPLSEALAIRPPDFHRDPWKHLKPDPSAAVFQEQVMRIIKFGVLGTSMPGHETLDDESLAALAARVIKLHTPPTP